MKILFAASEAAPYAKVGGLADVVGSLPAALSREGAECAIILPKYRSCAPYAERFLGTVPVTLGWRHQQAGLYVHEEADVKVFFVDNDYYFGGDSIYGYHEGEAEKFAFFSKAVLELLPIMGFMPDVLHCNDWQTGLIPVLLKTQYPSLRIKTVFSIHNLKYQGLYGYQLLKDLLGFPDSLFNSEQLEFYGGTSFLKAGLLYADKLTTVSPSYREETLTPALGERMEGVLACRKADYVGILNGLGAEYDPQTDPLIPYAYSAANVRNKSRCKTALRRELGLTDSPKTMLAVMVSRLYDQKGPDLLFDSIRRLLDSADLQLAVLGSGDPGYERFFRELADEYPGRVSVTIGYDNALAHRLYAGGDLFLMPSRYEPCGLAQLIAMKYGTLPLVRRTGGLADTVKDVADGGWGFCFDAPESRALEETLRRALAAYQKKPQWNDARRRAMSADFSWTESAARYGALYREICHD